MSWTLFFQVEAIIVTVGVMASAVVDSRVRSKRKEEK